MPIFSKPELRDTVAVLTGSVLEILANTASSPVIERSPFQKGWRRDQQEIFIADRPEIWTPPLNISQVGSLERFPAMGKVRGIIESDPQLRDRFDTSVGPWFSRTYVDLDVLLVRELITPLVLAAGSYVFDVTAFDQHYLRWEAGVLADQVRMIDYLPLNGFEAEARIDHVELPGGFVLAPMTDQQISAALGLGAVPVERTLSFTAVQIARQNQWALSLTEPHPVEFGYDNPDDPTRSAPSFARVENAGQQLVTALRIVCGGSITATRCLHEQHEQDFPLLTGTSAGMATMSAVDLQRSCVLFADRVEDLVQIFELLGRPEVEQDRTLALALRRLVFAGTRTEPIDRLLDLMICAEALFLKRAGAPPRGQSKARPVADAAADLLHDDPMLREELGTDADVAARLRKLMLTAYSRRNDEMHGEAEPKQETVTLLNGNASNDLVTAVADVERVLQLALVYTLRSSVTSR